VIHLGEMGRLELQGEFHQRVRQQIAAAKINDGAVLRLAGVVAIGLDHAHIVALHPLADGRPDNAQDMVQPPNSANH